MCSGSSTSATIASVNAPSNQLHHLSYDNAAYAGLDISTACDPPSLLEESMTSTQTSMAGRDLEAAPRLDGLIQSSTISILLASTPPMLPRWSLTDPSGRTLLADCLRSNPNKALKSILANVFEAIVLNWVDDVITPQIGELQFVRASEALVILQEEDKLVGMQISWPKTKLMAITPNPSNHLPLKYATRKYCLSIPSHILDP